MGRTCEHKQASHAAPGNRGSAGTIDPMIINGLVKSVSFSQEGIRVSVIRTESR